MTTATRPWYGEADARPEDLAAHPRTARRQRPGGARPRRRRRLWGETNDKVITNAGFVLIAFFPLFVLFASLLQWKLDKRKEARKRAAKERVARADLRGGW